MTFGHKLKSLRGGRVVSQKALAAKLEMDTAYLSRIENDVPNHLPSVATILRIIKALSLNAQDADSLYVLANKIPPDVAAKLLRFPDLWGVIRGIETRKNGSRKKRKS